LFVVCAESQVVLPWSVQLLCFYCGLIVVASVFGGVATSAVRITHTRLQLLVSFVGGLMLGVGLLHQLPHAVAMLADDGPQFALHWCPAWMMAGLLTMFFLLRMLHFHHHEPWDEGGPQSIVSFVPHDHDHNHDHDHDSGRHHHDHKSAGGVHGVSWAGVALGLCLHTILDGVALASHVQSDAMRHPEPGVWLGLGTFLGIALHKPLDSLSITSLMLAGGWSATWRHAVNFGYALMCPFGAALLLCGLRAVSAHEQLIASAALAFSAGVFVSIALSDLLPEVQFHSHDRIKLSAALLLGALVAWGIGWLEPERCQRPRSPFGRPARAVADTACRRLRPSRRQRPVTAGPLSF
jgi:zinc and cadmium transporter